MSLAQAAGRGMLASSARGRIGALALSSARGGGVGALALSSARGGGIGAAISSAGGGGVGALPPALGSARPFSSASPGGWKTFKPSKGMMVFCAVLSGFTGVCYCVGARHDRLKSETTERTALYLESKLVELKELQNEATGTHQDFFRNFNDATHAMQKEVSDLRSRMLALDQKTFDHRKELMVAAELLDRHEVAAAAAEGGGK